MTSGRLFACIVDTTSVTDGGSGRIENIVLVESHLSLEYSIPPKLVERGIERGCDAEGALNVALADDQLSESVSNGSNVTCFLGTLSSLR